MSFGICKPRMFVLSPWEDLGSWISRMHPPNFCSNQPDQPQISYQENWDKCFQNPENHQTKNLGAGPHWLPYSYLIVFYYHIHAKLSWIGFQKNTPWNSHHKISTPITSHKNVHFLKLTVKKHLKIDVYSCNTIYFPLGAWNPADIFTTPETVVETSGGPTYSGVETHGKARSCFVQRYPTPPRRFGWQPPHHWPWVRLAQVLLHLEIMKHTKHMKKNRSNLWVIVYVCLCKCQWYPS